LQEGQYESSVPVIMDRAHQARVKNALEPEREARFEPRSYGFRPGRGCQDAGSALFWTLKGKSRRVWILDADLTAAFDKISHSFLLEQLGLFPARDMIRDWLTAGVFEAGKGFAPTEEGTPQGGVISPLLLNIALHGLEEAAGVRYQGHDEARVEKDSPVLVRYADDFAVCCHTRQQAEQVKARLEGWLAGRGMSVSEDKTRIVHLTQGFDFPGWTVRRHRNGKLLIKPSKKAVRKHREQLAGKMRQLRGSNAMAVIATLSPVIRGWTAYHRCMVSSKVFGSLEDYMWKLTWKWARYSHENKPPGWVAARYYGTLSSSRNDRWVFGDKKTGAYLVKHPWTAIRRHIMVKGAASPDDPGLAGYWRYRRDKHAAPLDPHTCALLARQGKNCPLCGDPLIDTSHLPGSAEQWQDWWMSVTRRDIQPAPSEPGPLRQDGMRNAQASTALIHASCNRALKARARRSTALQLQPALS
jgi:RNA-directed DNA polymerase